MHDVMHNFTLVDHQLALLPERALFWPARRALIVADLHFEKASWYARTGQYLPPWDSAATLARLYALAERIDARELWCLGDNFHDAGGPTRLDQNCRTALAALADQLRLVWITGNHDADAAFTGEVMAEAVVDGLVLRHEADASETRPELSGHFHPKVRVATAARTVARPCFLHLGNRLILPAFGALTGGLDVGDPAFGHLRGNDDHALITTPRAMLRLPLPPAHAHAPSARSRHRRALTTG